jgi:hypothetical protein
VQGHGWFCFTEVLDSHAVDDKVKIAKNLEVVVAHFKVISQNGSDIKN